MRCECGATLTKIAEGTITKIWLCEECGYFMIQVVKTGKLYWYPATNISDAISGE